ncbi:glycoside hydrolase family 61 protein [Xylaria bambusicola]|uniref:glycoside hydrolase family 61 protein n=1 Tax=Xylaria bambusicola TaxID=326684 RepID=UPI0020088343|nr:glycoside hydrolase family 61 protein [Xylaria bambusicola]KAI0508699.1 glycoside hydrolase family 61 protein [Xylaria bambusicola]
MQILNTAFLRALTTLVAAHGYVDTASIGGSEYTFYQPYTDPYTSPTPERVSREIQGNGPVTDVTYEDIQCGGYTDGGIVGSSPATLHAEVAAGSTVTVRCDEYMPGTDAVWFKIAEDVRQGTSNKWRASYLMVSGNSSYKYTIPSCLAPGYYLVRHEIIALHSAYEYPGAQFYPGCHQLKVTGSGTTTPSSNLVAFPGAYKGSDPGITYDAYQTQEYTIPGPALFTC